MPDLQTIDDPVDPRLADFRDLSRADRRPDRPGGRGLVIAEGVVVVQRLLRSAYPVRAMLGVERRHAECAAGFPDGLPTDAPRYVVSADLMAQVVGFHLNRGLLATADRIDFPDASALLDSCTTVAVLEGVGDHENLGAIFRNAAALGVDAVLLGAGCADPLYRRAVRVSMGHVLAVPFTDLPGWPHEALDLLHQKGFRTVALTPAGELAPAGAAAALGRQRRAILLGAEGPGLTQEVIAAAAMRVRIPMAAGVDSLNVATAGAIAFAALGTTIG